MVVVVVVNRLVEKEGEEEDEEEEDVSSEDSTRLAIDARRNIIVCVWVGVKMCTISFYKNL